MYSIINQHIMAMKWKPFASFCTGFFALAACGNSDSADGSSDTYNRLLRTMYRNTVPTVTAATLVRQLRAPLAPLLLDIRTPAEFRVSHLRGARLVPYDSLATVQLADIDRRRPVVVYCSVGVRSERMGERLHALGFQQVHNLYGGIFQWINDGLPVYNSTGITRNVHPYSTLWGAWLKRGRKVYE